MELARQKQARIFAAQIRIETLKALGHLGFGHLGGSLSIADLLAVLYSGEMKVDPANPNWEDRDFLVCSKGHAGPAIYATLALRGFFPKEELLTKVWGMESDAEDNNVEVDISFLRKKFFYLGSRVGIGTVRKVGYRLEG